MNERVCARPGCGETFIPKTHNQRYHHPSCKRKVEAERKHLPPQPSKVCPHCGIEFQPNVTNQIYCTPAHQRQAQHAKANKPFEMPREFKELRIRSAPDGFKIIIINDLQRPFHDQRTIAVVEHFWDDFQPNLEIYNGDTNDLYTISTHDKNPSRRFRLQDELDDSRRWLQKRANANPAARRIFGDGNHEDHLRRWLWKFGPEFASLRGLKVDQLLGLEEFGFEHLEYGSVIDLLGYRIEHGYKTTGSKAYPMNTSRWMAIATGSSGLCGHTHRLSSYSWTDSRGSHTYVENGCLCRTDLEYAPFPNWQHAFSYGVVHRNKVHLTTVPIYETGFRAEGEFYAR